METIVPILEKNWFSLLTIGLIAFGLWKTKGNPFKLLIMFERSMVTRAGKIILYVALATTPIEIMILTDMSMSAGESLMSSLGRYGLAGVIEIAATFYFSYIIQPSLGRAAIDGNISAKEIIPIILVGTIALFVGLVCTTIIFMLYISVEHSTMENNALSLISNSLLYLTGNLKLPAPPAVIFSIYATPFSNMLLVFNYLFKIYHVKVNKIPMSVILAEEIATYEEMRDRNAAKAEEFKKKYEKKKEEEKKEDDEIDDDEIPEPAGGPPAPLYGDKPEKVIENDTGADVMGDFKKEAEGK